MVDSLLRRFVPDDLWEAVAPMTAHARRRRSSRVDDRAILAAVAFVLSTGCAWRHLPPCFGVAVPTAHRRYVTWTRLGLWRALPDMVTDPDTREWAQALLLAAEQRAARADAAPVVDDAAPAVDPEPPMLSMA